jgi:hypothetical protein
VNLSISGLPAIAIQIGFIVVFSAPVWLAAHIVKADHPTLLRSAISLVVGTIGAFAGMAVGGGAALLLAPLSFLLAFKFVLGTSFFGSVILAVVALVAYAAMVHFIGGGVNFSNGTTSV